MKFRNEGNQYVIVLERGEEVMSTLTEWCKKEGITAATFSAIGAVERVQIGYYDLAKKEYFFQNEPSIFEVASMNGNVALVENAPFIHAHAVLSRCDESRATIGGHVKEACVAVTLEISLSTLSGSLVREHNDSIGLKLLSL